MDADINKLKRSQLEKVASFRDKLKKEPNLRWLFFELTDKCNLNCRHCGSKCTANGKYLSVEDVKKVLGSLEQDKPMICLTGGEPLLHPDFFIIAECVKSMGFYWGITTNATLIDDIIAEKLKETGMSTISVSLDGLENSHDYLRQKKGSWKRAVRGIKCLQKAGFDPQVTSVFHRNNIDDIKPLYDFLSQMGINSWRPINIEPIGRACESGELLLDPEQFTSLLSFIREKRFDPSCNVEVTYGCSHYLGVKDERMVRDNYFLCGAGILVAGIRSNGDICACLDIENRPELIQGNIHRDDFIDIWRNRFHFFRKDRTVDCEKCINCSERSICGGDSAHTWDYGNNKPLLCYMDFIQSGEN